MIEKHRKTSILNMIRLNFQSELNLPSWVPNWTARRTPGTDEPSRLDEDEIMFSASQGRPKSLVFIGCGKLLRVHGYNVDCIASFGRPGAEDKTQKKARMFAEFANFLDSARKMAATSCKDYWQGASSDEILAMTCCRETAPNILLPDLLGII